jgi:plastocyanin domain-containing protein
LVSLPAKTTTTNNKNVNDPNVVIENGVQIVRMNQLSSGYKPNNFTIKKGVPVKWIINSKDINSCASSIYSQKLKIQSYLEIGDNVFEFTPSETGKITFSCSMGMYRGYFNVVE